LCRVLFNPLLQAVARAHELQPRHVSNICWSFAVRKAYSPALYQALAERVVTQLGASALEPHHCSLLAWSFAKQGVRHEALLQAIGDRAAAVADQMAPQVRESSVGFEPMLGDH
jgi:hypothetical protein